MKDSEFIELLNLYLDHEISATDAAKLEAEVAGNPARRRLYQDYCRMQKACKLLGEDFQTASPAEDGKVVAFSSARETSRSGWYVAGGLMAAAACVAFIFVSGPQSSSGPAPALAREVGIPMVQGDRAIGRTVSVPAREEPRAVLVSALSLAGVNDAKPSSLFVAADQAGAQFDWMRTLELAPVQQMSDERLRFEGLSGLQKESRPASRRSTTADQNVEWVAFKFQR